MQGPLATRDETPGFPAVALIGSFIVSCHPAVFSFDWWSLDQGPGNPANVIGGNPMKSKDWFGRVEQGQRSGPRPHDITGLDFIFYCKVMLVDDS